MDREESAVRAMPVNMTNELAKERNRAAADRSLMAWIRTSLSLITFGFGIDKVIDAINRARFGTPSSVGTGVTIVSVGFIVVGMLSLIAALVEHRSVLRRIGREAFVYEERRSIAGWTASLIILIGAIALFTIVRG